MANKHTNNTKNGLPFARFDNKGLLYWLPIEKKSPQQMNRSKSDERQHFPISHWILLLSSVLRCFIGTCHSIHLLPWSFVVTKLPLGFCYFSSSSSSQTHSRLLLFFCCFIFSIFNGIPNLCTHFIVTECGPLQFTDTLLSQTKCFFFTVKLRKNMVTFHFRYFHIVFSKEETINKYSLLRKPTSACTKARDSMKPGWCKSCF